MKIKKGVLKYLLAAIPFLLAIAGIFLSVHGPASYADLNEGADIYKAIQQVAFSYYMRGPYLQYNSQIANSSGAYASPEETTKQNHNYLTCSAFVKNVYNDLIGVQTPPWTSLLLDYGQDHLGESEVVLYGEKIPDDNDASKKQIWVYDENTGSAIEMGNPTTDKIVKLLKIGDILTYTGHTMLVYDLIRDTNGDIIDAKIIESGHLFGAHHAETKIPHHLVIRKEEGGQTITELELGSANSHQLYYSYGTMSTEFDDGRVQGTLRISTFKTVSTWKNIAEGTSERYSILRFLKEDNGKVLLTYYGEGIPGITERNYENVEVTLPQKTLDRLKFNNLYIEKTVDVFADSIVQPGDRLTYSIKIQNESPYDYVNDLHVTENISPYATYGSYSADKQITLSGLTAEQISWNIGRLKSGESVTINYEINVKDGTLGQTIESTGTVESIPSATIKNKISKRLPSYIAEKIDDIYNNLKQTYSGKELINKIYLQATGEDLGLTDFNIKELVLNTRPTSDSINTIGLNTNSSMYASILTNYWSTLVEKEKTYNNDVVYDYDLKDWGPYNSETRRADTIYKGNFRTGDILIYTNHDDVAHKYSKETGLTETNITYENGEYVYIFIEGRGFVGINYGQDGIPGTLDDRNAFTLDYYTDNGLHVYSDENETNVDLLEFMNYQTLLGKDYYVILRPALAMNLTVATYTISYDANGGSGNMDDQIVEEGETVNLSTNTFTPPSSDYTFASWNTKADGTGDIYNDKASITDLADPEESITLYAQWKRTAKPEPEPEPEPEPKPEDKPEVNPDEDSDIDVPNTGYSSKDNDGTTNSFVLAGILITSLMPIALVVRRNKKDHRVFDQ